jgi:hypothetical protein
MCNTGKENLQFRLRQAQCAVQTKGDPMGEAVLEARGGPEQLERGTAQKCSYKGYSGKLKLRLG